MKFLKYLVLMFAFVVTPALAAPPVSPPIPIPNPLPTDRGGTGKQVYSPALNITYLSDFGICAGTDDTAIFRSAISYASTHGKKLKLNQLGCKVYPTPSAPVMTLVGSKWEIYGDGEGTEIEIMSDGDFIRSDNSTFTSSYNSYRDFRVISHLGDGNRANTNVIHFYCDSSNASNIDAGTCQWTSFQDIRNIYFSGVNALVKADRTGWVLWNAAGSDVYSLQKYGEISIIGNHGDNSSGISHQFVQFDSGAGTMLLVQGNQVLADYGIYIGDGDSGTGDYIFASNHLTINTGSRIKILGPTNLDYYRRNITIIANQMDGDGADTFYCSNVIGIRLFGNNSTNSQGYNLNNCSFALFENKYSGFSHFGTSKQTFTTGNISRAMFYLTRVEQIGLQQLWGSVNVKVHCDGLIAGIGDVYLDGEYIVRFNGTIGATPTVRVDTIRQIKGGWIQTGPTDAASDHIDITFGPFFTTQAVATINMSNLASSGSQLTCQASVEGDKAMITPGTGN